MDVSISTSGGHFPWSAEWIVALATVAGAIFTLLAVAIAAATARAAVRQIREMRQASHATALKSVYDILQAENLRKDRRFVVEELRHKSRWTVDDRLRAERVCGAYDLVGIMCRNAFIDTHVVADSWGDSTRRNWIVLWPFLDKVRHDRSPEFWDDFEWLAAQAFSILCDRALQPNPELAPRLSWDEFESLTKRHSGSA